MFIWTLTQYQSNWYGKLIHFIQSGLIIMYTPKKITSINIFKCHFIAICEKLILKPFFKKFFLSYEYNNMLSQVLVQHWRTWTKNEQKTYRTVDGCQQLAIELTYAVGCPFHFFLCHHNQFTCSPSSALSSSLTTLYI